MSTAHFRFNTDFATCAASVRRNPVMPKHVMPCSNAEAAASSASARRTSLHRTASRCTTASSAAIRHWLSEIDVSRVAQNVEHSADHAAPGQSIVLQPDAFTAMTLISVSPRTADLHVVAPSRDEPTPADARQTA
ncbi:hypothetical protein, partial [Burkholderia stabilis]